MQSPHETHIRRFIMGGHIKNVSKQLNIIKCGPFTIGMASNHPKKCKSCKSHMIHKYLVKNGPNTIGTITYCMECGGTTHNGTNWIGTVNAHQFDGVLAHIAQKED